MNVNFIKEWIKDRIKEPTTWNGWALVGIGVGILLIEWAIPYLAYASMAYGIYAIVTPEEKRWVPKI